jgi:PilZ domain
VSQTSLPQQGTAKTVSGNRRATVRYRCAPATLGKVYLSEDQEYQRACVVNLSLKGVGLQLSRPLEVGQFVLLVIRSNDDKKIYELSAQVARCEATPHHDWLIGCELTNSLTPEELDHLL